MKIIRAVLAGERDPQRLAALRHGKCKHDEATIAAALQGDWREEHLFALEQAVELVDAYQTKIAACDARIQAHLARFADRGTGAPPPPGPGPAPTGTTSASMPPPSCTGLTGVDLTAIAGLGAHTALKVLSEIGLDMTRWPSAKHFGAWLGLAPNNRVSGGKILSRRTTPTANRAATALRVAAQSLHRSKSALGAFLRRKAAHLGMPKAITATAYKLARLLYAMLSTGHRRTSNSARTPTSAPTPRASSARLSRRANELGYHLVKHEPSQSHPPPPDNEGRDICH